MGANNHLTVVPDDSEQSDDSENDDVQPNYGVMK